jgi:uncharacterized protein Smg (DUF494 family)
MQEKIVEILIYLIGELQKNTPIAEIDLSILSKSGYTPAEISTAFTWLYEKIERGENIIIDQSTRSPHSQRILHDAERMVITPEAFGYLIQMRELGIISDIDIEVIIDRVMMSGYFSVDVEEMKSQAAALVLENGESADSGSRKMLHGRDTIH